MNNHLISLIILIIGVIFFIEYYRVNNYSIDGQKIIINRMFRNLHIEISQIAELKEIKSIRELKLILRLWGISFLSIVMPSGIFLSYKYGIIHLYLTKRVNILLITLKNRRKYVISPDEYERALIESCYSR